MDSQAAHFFYIVVVSAALLLTVGFYSLLRTRNLIRALIGMEILTKAVTLLIIGAGHAAGRMALAQALAITLIIVEVVVIVVAVSIVVRIHEHTESLDPEDLRSLRG